MARKKTDGLSTEPEATAEPEHQWSDGQLLTQLEFARDAHERAEEQVRAAQKQFDVAAANLEGKKLAALQTGEPLDIARARCVKAGLEIK